jgi:hypothetical protein
VGPFTTPDGIDPYFDSSTVLVALDSTGYSVDLYFFTATAGSLVGYTGGPLFGVIVQPNNGVPGDAWGSFSGSLTAIPEPSTWALMALGFGLLGNAGWRTRGRSISIAA